jgi:hypothetical protein
VQLEGLGQLKNPVTASGIEPATFLLVAYRLNQLLYGVPLTVCVIVTKTVINDGNLKLSLHHCYSFVGHCLSV